MILRKHVSIGIFVILVWYQILCGQDASNVPLQVILTPLKTNYKITETLMYEIRIENIGNDTIRIPKDVRSRYYPRMIGPEGRVVAWEYLVVASGFFDESNTIELTPGYSYGGKCSWSGLDEPGEYSFYVVYVAPANFGDSLSHYWHGTLESNKVQIIVK